MKLIIDILTIFYCILSISSVGTNETYAIISILLSIIIFIYNTRKQKKLIVENKTLLFYILFLLFVTMVIFVSWRNEYYYVLNLFSMFLPIILYCHYSKRNDYGRLVNIIILIWVVIAIRACYLYSSGQLSARYVISHVQMDIPFSGGGYGFAIGSTILATFLLDVCLWKKMKKKYILIIFIGLLFNLVLLTKSTTTLIALIIGFISSILFRLFHISSLLSLNKKQLIGLMFLVIFCVIIVYQKSKIGNYIISMADGSDILSLRIKEFGALLSGNDLNNIDTSDSLDRMERIISSMRLFAKYPIFGIVSVVGMNHYAQINIGLGGHAEMFDTYARYGFLGGTLFLLIFINGIKEVIKNKKCNIGFGFIIAFIILFLFNPFIYKHVNIAVFLLLPLLSKKFLNGDNYD